MIRELVKRSLKSIGVSVVRSVCVPVCEQPKLHFASADFDETRYVGPPRVQVCRFADSATSAPLRRNYQRKTSVAFRYECTYRSYALRRSTSSSSRLQHACHTPRRQLLRCELTSSRIIFRPPACIIYVCSELVAATTGARHTNQCKPTQRRMRWPVGYKPRP